MNNFGGIFGRFLFINVAIGDNYYFIPFFTHSGGRAAQGDFPFFPRDRVSFKAVAVIKIQNMDLFTGENSGRFQKRRIDRNAAFVMEEGVGDGGHMDLAFQDCNQHCENYT